jgi:hypothetical protein
MLLLLSMIFLLMHICTYKFLFSFEAYTQTYVCARMKLMYGLKKMQQVLVSYIGTGNGATWLPVHGMYVLPALFQ